MTTLTLELAKNVHLLVHPVGRLARQPGGVPPDLDQRLHAEAERLGKPPQTVVQEWLAERLALTPPRHLRASARRCGGFCKKLGSWQNSVPNFADVRKTRGPV